MVGVRILVRIVYGENFRFLLRCTDNFTFQQIKMIAIITFSQSVEFQIDINQVRCLFNVIEMNRALGHLCAHIG